MQVFSVNDGGTVWKRLLLFASISIPVWLGAHHVVPYRLLELALLGGMVFILLGHEPLVTTFQSAPRFYRLCSIGLLVLLVLGHLARQDDYTFPFVGWTMYGRVRSNPAPVFYEYTAVLQTGQRVSFNPIQALPSTGNRITTELAEQINAIEGAKDAQRRAQYMSKHEATLRALISLYNEQHKDEPVQALTVSKYTVPLDGYKMDARIPRQTLWQINMEDA